MFHAKRLGRNTLLSPQILRTYVCASRPPGAGTRCMTETNALWTPSRGLLMAAFCDCSMCDVYGSAWARRGGSSGRWLGSQTMEQEDRCIPFREDDGDLDTGLDRVDLDWSFYA